MSLRVYCRRCLFTTHVNDDLPGQPLACPQCGESMLVPESSAVAEAGPEIAPLPSPVAESLLEQTPVGGEAETAPIPAPIAVPTARSRLRTIAAYAGGAVALAGVVTISFLAGRYWPEIVSASANWSFSLAAGENVTNRSHGPSSASPVAPAPMISNEPPTAAEQSAPATDKPPLAVVPPASPAVPPHDFGPEPPRPLADTFPKLVVEGTSFAHQLPRSANVQYELLYGPEGLTVTSGGKVTWTPSRRQMGVHELKIRVQRDGMSLYERPTVEVVDQKLADTMGGKLSKPPPTAKFPRVSAAEFQALGALDQTASLTSKEIGRRYLNAVVVVHGEKSVGTGFIVGKNGYVMTCAHVVPQDGQIILAYNLTKDGQTEAVSTTATVLLVDEARDLALLKIQPREPLTHVFLHEDKPVETGEAITVIGNPGLGSTILTQTMTTGIISNPDRELDGQHYIQSSAAVNPGNSGGPMFDSFGRVVGLVSLKGNIEGAGFAVPARVLREFLKGLIDGDPVSSK